MERLREPSRLEAVDDVVVLAHPAVRDAMHTFYAHIAGLSPSNSSDGDELCFRSEHLYLRIRLDRQPAVNPNIRRAVIVVDSLDALVRRLDEHKIEREMQHGLGWASRRIYAADPAGNRIEFKQYWLL